MSMKREEKAKKNQEEKQKSQDIHVAPTSHRGG